MRRSIAWLRAVSPLICILAIWSLLPFIVVSGSLPSPVTAIRSLILTSTFDRVIQAQGGGDGGYLPHVWSTCWHVTVGTVAGILLSVLLSAVATVSGAMLGFFGALIEIVGALPALIFVPFVAVLLGPSDVVQIVSVGVYSFITMCPHAISALQRVNKEYSGAARLLGAKRLRTLLLVQLPGITPALLGPIRLTFAYGIGISVVVEYLVAPSGIGRVMKLGAAYTNPELVFTGVLWAILLAFVFDGALLLIFRPILVWTERRQLLEWLARGVNKVYLK